MTILEILNRVLEILRIERYTMNAESLAQAIKQLQNGEPVTNKLVEEGNNERTDERKARS